MQPVPWKLRNLGGAWSFNGEVCSKIGKRIGKSGSLWKIGASPDLRGWFLRGRKRQKVMVTYKTDLAVRLWAGREPGGFVKKTALAGKFPRGYTRGSS